MDLRDGPFDRANLGSGGGYIGALLQQAKAFNALENTPFFFKTAPGMAARNNAACTSSP